MKTSGYAVDCECSNCGCSGSVTFPRGTPVPTTFECPNCGCDTARKYDRPYKVGPKKPYMPKRPWDDGHDFWHYGGPSDIKVTMSSPKDSEIRGIVQDFFKNV